MAWWRPAPSRKPRWPPPRRSMDTLKPASTGPGRGSNSHGPGAGRPHVPAGRSHIPTDGAGGITARRRQCRRTERRRQHRLVTAQQRGRWPLHPHPGERRDNAGLDLVPGWSLAFFVTAGVLAGLSFRRAAQDRYAVLDSGEPPTYGLDDTPTQPADEDSWPEFAPLMAARRWLLLMLVLVAYALRVIGLDRQSLWRDEVDAIYFAVRELPTTLGHVRAKRRKMVPSTFLGCARGLSSWAPRSSRCAIRPWWLGR